MRPASPDACSSAPAARRWAVLYDAECGFCKWALARLLRRDRASRLRPLALQSSAADALLAGLTLEERMASWHLVSPGGVRSSAGQALAPALRLLPGGRIPAAVISRLPAPTERAYRWVADHRSELSRWVPAASRRRASEYVRARERAQWPSS
jgi:predicted DCC family thiol-disulfide oxidoreductase YuxK